MILIQHTRATGRKNIPATVTTKVSNMCLNTQVSQLTKNTHQDGRRPKIEKNSRQHDEHHSHNAQQRQEEVVAQVYVLLPVSKRDAAGVVRKTPFRELFTDSSDFLQTIEVIKLLMTKLCALKSFHHLLMLNE